MAHRQNDPDPPRRRRAPARTLEARENQLIAAAVDLAERRILDGTASSQVVIHYLKLGTTREQLEKERLIQENELLRAKTESLRSTVRGEELYAKAVDALRSYSSSSGDDTEDD